MKKLPYKLLFGLVLILLSLSCRQQGENPESEEISFDKVLVTLPEAVNAPDGNGQTGEEGTPPVKTTVDDMLESIRNIYNPVRDWYNPLAAAAIDQTNLLLQEIEKNIFQNPDLMKIIYAEGVFEHTDDNATQKGRITYNENTYRVEFWISLEQTWLKHLDVEFTKEGERYFGRIFIREQQANPENRPEFRIDFDTRDPSLQQQVMELRIVNLDYDDPAVDDFTEDYNIPTKLWLKARQDNETFYSAANVYFKKLHQEENSDFYPYFMTILNNGDPYVYGSTLVNANYIYRCAVDLVADRGAVDLALVPEAIDETATIFADYSIGHIYKEAFAEYIRKDAIDDTPLTELMNIMLTQAGSNIELSETSTTEEIFEALVVIQEYYEKQGEDTEAFDTLLFIVKLVNPGYFDAQTGFVGNDEILAPEWSSDVPAFADFELLSAADVAGDNFTVVMPDDGPPDF